jgi:flagellar biogenesis protein FliO
LAIVALFCAVSIVRAQSTKPAIAVEPTTVPVGIHEKQAIQRTALGSANKNAPAGSKVVVPTSTGMDATRVVLSLLLVIAIIFLLRWIAQQYFGAPSTKRSSRAVQVLSRSMIAPKQHVLVLQVGRRLIVVGDSGTQMNPLCEITDEDEIASLMGQLKQDKADPVTRAFGSFFGKAEKEYDGEAADTQLRASGSTDPAVDPELATTRAELSGLIEKVRSVSKQIGQSDA